MNKNASRKLIRSLSVSSVFGALLIYSSLGFAQSETLYVTDSWRFEIRQEPCWDCDISRSLTSGTELQVIETEETVEGWRYVRSSGGTEGWISERYVTDQPSAASQLEEALSISTYAATEQALLREQFTQLSEELLSAGIEVELIEVTSEDGSVTIQAPQVIGNLATVGHQNQDLLRRNQLLQNELDLRSAEIDRLNDDRWKAHFVYGGGAIFAGVILCLILTRLKPRRGYSEWA